MAFLFNIFSILIALFLFQFAERYPQSVLGVELSSLGLSVLGFFLVGFVRQYRSERRDLRGAPRWVLYIPFAVLAIFGTLPFLSNSTVQWVQNFYYILFSLGSAIAQTPAMRRSFGRNGDKPVVGPTVPVDQTAVFHIALRAVCSVALIFLTVFSTDFAWLMCFVLASVVRAYAEKLKPMNDQNEAKRVLVLHSAVELSEPLEALEALLKEFPFDFDGTPVLVTSVHLQDALKRCQKQELSPHDIEAWANLLEGREDIAFENDQVKELMHELATPVLFEPITPDLCGGLLKRLGEDDRKDTTS